MSKVIRVDDFTHGIFMCEAARQQGQEAKKVSVGMVLNKVAQGLNKKHGFIHDKMTRRKRRKK